MCPQIPVKINSSGLEVFRLDRFGIDVFELNRLGLITCERWDLFVLIRHGPSQGIPGLRVIGLVCEGETVGKIGEMDEMSERELVLGSQCQVRQGMRHDAWMTIVLGTQRCAILSLGQRVFA